MLGIPFLGRNRHRVYQDDEDEDPWAYLWELEYAFEFNPDQRAYLYRASECQRLGGMFQILREAGNNNQSGGILKPLAVVDYFPTQEDVQRICEDQHGGGHYVIQATKPTRSTVKTYILEGAPKYQSRSHGKSATLTTKQMVDAEMSGTLKTMMDEDPEIKAAVMAAHLKKSLGIDIAANKKDAFGERFDKYLTENPDQEIELFKAEIRKRGGADQETEWDKMTGMLSRIGDLQTLVNKAGGGGDTSIKGMITEGLKSLPAIMQQMSAAQNGQAIVEQPPIQAAPPPQPATRVEAHPRQTTFRPQGSIVEPQGPEVMVSGPRDGFPAPKIVESVGGTNEMTSVPVDRTPPQAQPTHRNGGSGFTVESSGPPPVQGGAVGDGEGEGEVLELDTTDIDWGALLTSTDWADLERATDGDPEVFAKDLYVRAYDYDDKGAQVLVKLFENNLPNAIVRGFVTGKEWMSKGWVQALVATQNKGDDFQAMLRVVDKLAYTEDGCAWVNQVHYCCGALKQRVEEIKVLAAQKAQAEQGTDEGTVEVPDATWVDDVGEGEGDDDDYDRLL